MRTPLCTRRRSSLFPRHAWLAALAATATMTVCQAADPEAEKLLASAKMHEAAAEKDRALAAARLQESNAAELHAKAEQREANILAAKALLLLKADANQQKAFQLRREAQRLGNEAHRRLVVAHNDELRMAHLKQSAQELRKAADDVKDQAQISQQLAAQADADASEASRLDGLIAAERKAAENEERQAAAAWSESEKLYPEMHRQLGPRPERPALRGAQDK